MMPRRIRYGRTVWTCLWYMGFVSTHSPPWSRVAEGPTLRAGAYWLTVASTSPSLPLPLWSHSSLSLRSGFNGAALSRRVIQWERTSSSSQVRSCFFLLMDLHYALLSSGFLPLLSVALITGLECVIEKYRAKHDVKNAAIAGCITGATFAASQGPTVGPHPRPDQSSLHSPRLTHTVICDFEQAMCVGCAGFTAFSVAMDSLMDLH